MVRKPPKRLHFRSILKSRSFGNTIANTKLVQVSLTNATNKSPAPTGQARFATADPQSFLQMLSGCGGTSNLSLKVQPESMAANTGKALQLDARQRKPARVASGNDEKSAQRDQAQLATTQPGGLPVVTVPLQTVPATQQNSDCVEQGVNSGSIPDASSVWGAPYGAIPAPSQGGDSLAAVTEPTPAEAPDPSEPQATSETSPSSPHELVTANALPDTGSAPVATPQIHPQSSPDQQHAPSPELSAKNASRVAARKDTHAPHSAIQPSTPIDLPSSAAVALAPNSDLRAVAVAPPNIEVGTQPNTAPAAHVALAMSAKKNIGSNIAALPQVDPVTNAAMLATPAPASTTVPDPKSSDTTLLNNGRKLGADTGSPTSPPVASGPSANFAAHVTPPASTPSDKPQGQPHPDLQPGAADHTASKDPAAPWAPHSASLSTARLVQTVGRSEMQVSLHSEDLGRLTVRTAFGHDAVSAQITLENAQLGSVLSTHASSLEQKLAQDHGLRASVTVDTQSSGSGARQDSDQQQSGGRQQSRFQSFAQSSVLPEGSLSTIPLSSQPGASGSRLDIRI